MNLLHVFCVFAFWCIFGSDHIDDQELEIINSAIEIINQRPDLSEKERAVRALVLKLYRPQFDQIQAIDSIDDIDGMSNDHEISPTIRWLIKEDLDPNNTQYDENGDTLLHHLTRMSSWYDNNNSIDCTAEIQRLFIYGANPYIKNEDNKSPSAFDLATEKKRETIYGQWGDVKRDDIEQGDHSWTRLVPGSCPLPTFVRNHYRYGNDFKKNDQINNRILFLIVHGTGVFEDQGRNNANYYDENTPAFRGLMNFAQMYADAKNRKRDNKGKQPKILHLMSFMWNGHLLDFNREGSAAKLTKILRNRHYQDAHVVLVGHSHGCNVINFALNQLNAKYHRLLSEKNRKRISKQGKLPKGFAQLLFFLAPPCKQVFPDSEPKRTLLLDHLYGWANDSTANVPIGYDQLILAYSDKDLTAKVGSVDIKTAIIAIVIVIPTTIVVYKYRNEIYNTGKSCVSTIGFSQVSDNSIDAKTKLIAISYVVSWVYSICINKRAGSRKVKYAHKYTDVMPINECDKEKGIFLIKGPKTQAQIMLNGEKIGHSCPELLENLGYVWERFVTQYPGHLACSSEFIVNINTIEKNKSIENPKFIQCFLPEMKKKLGKRSFYGIKKVFSSENVPERPTDTLYYINRTKTREPGDFSMLHKEETRHKKNYDVFRAVCNKKIPVRILQ